jgi:hypothetical protein
MSVDETLHCETRCHLLRITCIIQIADPFGSAIALEDVIFAALTVYTRKVLYTY